MVPIVHVFLYFDGNKVSVDGVSYLDLLQEVIWPEIADRSALWSGAPFQFQPGGGSCPKHQIYHIHLEVGVPINKAILSL